MTTSQVKSADRLMQVLDLLARQARPVPTMTIVRECGIPKSSAHHLLNAMRARDFVAYHEVERAWGLGVAVLEIGSAYLRSGAVQRMGRHLLIDLTERTGETSHLAVLSGAEVLYIDKQQPAGSATQLVTEVGVRLPAHLTAVGRAMLAELSAAQVRALFADRPLSLRTARGPASIDALLEDLAAIRERGVAIDEGMVTPGISCVAAPVLSHEGTPVAAVGVTYVSAQRTAAQRRSAAALVREASGRLSSSLGHARHADGARAAG